FAPQVAAESKTKEYMALATSWIMIVAYLWFRFGSVKWGLAAVVALIHDALIALAFVSAAYLIAETFLGRALMVEAFRIDLAIVAAMLTVVGYSVNDTIIVFDRIRENRGKLTRVTSQMVNQSINQTLARTVLTTISTLLVILTMYIFGGRAIHGFNFVMLIGIITGTYSSIAVASPLLTLLHRGRTARAG
ncbi:MAG: protein translocase subunit SecF, partial [Phycisphaerae bacterium]